MSLRHFLSMLLKRSKPFMYAAGILFKNQKTLEKPHADEKLHLETANIKDLSFDYMIKQSTVDAVNSASRALTIAYTAIKVTSNEYRALLSELISLLEETLTYEVPNSHWDKIVEVRVKMNRKKESVNQLIHYMDYVHKMAVAVSEICFLSGMDDLSNTLYQRLEDAVTNLKKEVELNKELENIYSSAQESCITAENNKNS